MAVLILTFFLLANGCTQRGDYGPIIEALFLNKRDGAFVCRNMGGVRTQ